MSTDFQIAAPADTSFDVQAGLSNNFQVQVQLDMTMPEPSFNLPEPTVQAQLDVNPELLTQCENATMLPQIGASGGSFLSDSFGMTCGALSAQTSEVDAQINPDVAALPQPIPELAAPAPELANNSWTPAPPMSA